MMLPENVHVVGSQFLEISSKIGFSVVTITSSLATPFCDFSQAYMPRGSLHPSLVVSPPHRVVAPIL